LKTKKAQARVKHGPNGLTPPYIASKNWCEESDHLTDGYEATLLHQSPGL